MARPTSYNEEIQAKAEEYLEEWGKTDDVIPSVEGLSEHIDRARSTIYEWAKHEDKKEFSDTLEKINVLQKKVLINKGLTGDFNSNITKLALTNHGMSDKLKQEITGGDGGPIQVTGIDITFVEPKGEEREDE